MDILVWGIGKTFLKAQRMLKETVCIKVFLDSNAKAGQLFENIPVVRPEMIFGFHYDKIVVCSVYKEEIQKKMAECNMDENQIIWFDEKKIESFFINKADFFHRKIQDFRDRNCAPEIVIMGISYHNDGIFESAFPMCALNIALRGQDIFYDFQIIKWLYAEKYMYSLKYVIIGLCYYSFELDLSKTINAWEISRYYPEIKNAHNFMEDKYFGQWCKTMQGEMNGHGIYEELFERRPVGELTYEHGRQVAMADYNKNYPSTVYENKKILAEYLDFLEEKGVKPIVVIMPATRYYTKYCNLGLKARFYNDLQEVIGSKKIQILDYFDKLDYPDEYWYHVNHFNKTGAEIFTRQLIKDIEW